MSVISIACRIAGVKYDNAIEKYLGRVDISVIDDASNNDPSGTDKYLDWILKQITSGQDRDEVFRAVETYDQNRQKFKDLGLGTSIESFKNPDSILDYQSEIIKQRFNQYKSALSSDSKVVYPTSGMSRFIVATMPTHESAMHNGVGTRWCITNPDGIAWSKYSGVFFIVYDVLTDAKYAVYLPTNGNMRIYDSSDKTMMHRTFFKLLGDEANSIISVIRKNTQSSVDSDWEEKKLLKRIDELKDTTAVEAKEIVEKRDYESIRALDPKVLSQLADDESIDIQDRKILLEYMDPDDVMRHLDLLNEYNVHEVIPNLSIRQIMQLHKLNNDRIDIASLVRLPPGKRSEYLAHVFNRGASISNLLGHHTGSEKLIKDYVIEFIRSPPTNLNDLAKVSILQDLSYMRDIRSELGPDKLSLFKDSISDTAAFLNPEAYELKGSPDVTTLKKKFVDTPFDEVLDFVRKSPRKISDNMVSEVIQRTITEKGIEGLVAIIPFLARDPNFYGFKDIIQRRVEKGQESAIHDVLAQNINWYDEFDPLYSLAVEKAVSLGLHKALKQVHKAKLSYENIQMLKQLYPDIEEFKALVPN